MSSPVVWFIIGALLMLAELFTPSFIIVFFGLGSWGAALASLFPLGLEWQLAIFIFVSLASLLFLRRRMLETFQGKQFAHKKHSPDFPHAGRQADVTKAISPTAEGEISFGGSFWRATATENVAAGAVVRVMAPSEDDELLLLVEPMQADSSETHASEKSA